MHIRPNNSPSYQPKYHPEPKKVPLQTREKARRLRQRAAADHNNRTHKFDYKISDPQGDRLAAWVAGDLRRTPVSPEEYTIGRMHHSRTFRLSDVVTWLEMCNVARDKAEGEATKLIARLKKAGQIAYGSHYRAWVMADGVSA